MSAAVRPADSPSTSWTGLPRMYPKASRCGIRRRSRQPRTIAVYHPEYPPTPRCLRIVRPAPRPRRECSRIGERLCRCVFRVQDILVLDLRKLTHRFGVAHDVQHVLELRVRMFVLLHQPTFRVAVPFHGLTRSFLGAHRVPWIGAVGTVHQKFFRAGK